MKHKLNKQQKKQLNINRTKQLKFASSINDMQDHPVSGFSLKNFTHKRHLLNILVAKYKNSSIVHKTMLFGVVFLIAVYCGASSYENHLDKSFDPPMTKAEIKANDRIAKRNEHRDKLDSEKNKLAKKDRAQKIHKIDSFKLHVSLNSSQVHQFEQLRKEHHPYEAWALKTTDVYKKRMQVARSIIQGYRIKEGHYYRLINQYNDSIKEYSNQNTPNGDRLVKHYKHLKKNAKYELNYWHKKAKFLWKYRHRIRRIFKSKHIHLHLNLNKNIHDNSSHFGDNSYNKDNESKNSDRYPITNVHHYFTSASRNSGIYKSNSISSKPKSTISTNSNNTKSTNNTSSSNQGHQSAFVKDASQSNKSAH